MTSTDRIQGLTGNIAVKIPCIAATTANITLSAAQTIDGIACVAGDRVLVKSQTDTTENGIYDVSTGAWTRAKDFNGNGDIRNGTIVLVTTGSTQGVNFFRASVTEPVTIGTSAIAFVAVNGAFEGTYQHPGTGSVATSTNDIFENPVNALYFGAVGDNATTTTTALQAAITASAGGTLYIPTGIYLTGALTVPANTRIVGDGYGKTVLKAASASGSLDLLTLGNSNCSVEDLTVDLNNTANTIAAGYVASRNGIYVIGAVGTYITNIYLKVQVKNCGEAAILCKYVDRITIDHADIDRCGESGIICYSCSNVWVDTPDVYDIFPGTAGVAPYLNCYGVAFSYSGGDPVCTDCTVINGMVQNVTGWEAYDTHGGKRIKFINCSSQNCAQAIAIQSTAIGYESDHISIIGGTHVGYGNTTRDSTSFDVGSGIAANMGNGTTKGKNLQISGVTVVSMGGKQTGSTGAGIKVESCDTFLVTGNTMVNCYQWAYRCHETNLNGVMTNNAIVGLIEANSIKHGFSFSNTTFCVVDNNTISGLPASSIPWYILAPASSTYGIRFGANNTMEQSGIDHFADTSYRNVLAGSGFLGIAKAWCQYQGSTDTVVDRYGITGVTKNSTGTYTFTLADTISTTDSIVIATGNRIVRKASGASTSSFQILCESAVGVAADDDELSVVVFGIIQRK